MDTITASLICIVMGILFVGVLYLAPTEVAKLDRNDSRQIKWRMYALCYVSGICPIIVYYFLNDTDRNIGSLFMKLGVLPSNNNNNNNNNNTENINIIVNLIQWIWKGIFIPTFVTVSLFIGPLLENYYEGIEFKRNPIFSIKQIYQSYTDDMVSIRAYVLAPIFEEWVFRACMISILQENQMSIKNITMYSPFYFGIAHLHHAYNMIYKEKQPWKRSLLICFIQFLYTSLFGSYVAYVFCQTSNIYGIIIQHSFCNYMSLPQPQVWFHNKHHYLYKYSLKLYAGYLIGIIAFYYFVQFI